MFDKTLDEGKGSGQGAEVGKESQERASAKCCFKARRKGFDWSGGDELLLLG